LFKLCFVVVVEDAEEEVQQSVLCLRQYPHRVQKSGLGGD
jgi:hypothetical protein